MIISEGIVPPMITPLLSENELDIDGLNNLIEHLISGGVDGLFILGTTGEGLSLSHRLRKELIQKVCEFVNGRVPILVGLLDTSYQESIQLAEHATKLGAHGFVIAPPCFFNIEQDELYQFVSKILTEVDLPVYLYNNPSLTKVSFELETVKKLLSNPQVHGMKDSSGDMKYFQKLQSYAEATGSSLFIGPEELLMQSVMVGGNGGVAGGANIFPQLYVDLFTETKAGNLKKSRELHNKVIQLSDIVYSGAGSGAGRVISGIKTTLHCMGICNDYIAKPLSKSDHDKVKRIEEWVANDLNSYQTGN